MTGQQNGQGSIQIERKLERTRDEPVEFGATLT